MKLTNIHLDGDGKPDVVTVEMTRREAQFIAVVTGQMNPQQAEETLQGSGDASLEIYSALAGSVFNRFWEDGVGESIREDKS